MAIQDPEPGGGGGGGGVLMNINEMYYCLLSIPTPNAICSAMHILILSIYIGAASVVHTTCTSSHSVHEVHCTTHTAST